jgi:hypothetical protein
LHAPIHHHVLELGIPQLGDKQVRVKPTDNWEQLKLLCGWLEQERYEEICPLALFGSAVVQYAMEGGGRRLGLLETACLPQSHTTPLSQASSLPLCMLWTSNLSMNYR